MFPTDTYSTLLLKILSLQLGFSIIIKLYLLNNFIEVTVSPVKKLIVFKINLKMSRRFGYHTLSYTSGEEGHAWGLKKF